MRIVFSILLLLLLQIVSSSASSVHRNKQAIRQFDGPWKYIPLAGSHTVNLNSWFCGASESQWSATQKTIALTCDEKMPEINGCCAIHDACYDNLAVGSREGCDEHFCSCLDRAMSQPNLSFPCTSLITDLACWLVEEFGLFVYGEKHYSPPILISYHPALNQTANRAYNRLYNECGNNRKPLISCAYNHMVCSLKMLPAERYKQEYTDCREKLLKCVEDTSEFLGWRKNETCATQLEITLNAIKDDARLSGRPLDQHYVWSKTALELPTTTDGSTTTTDDVDISTATEMLTDIVTGSQETPETTEDLSHIMIGDPSEDYDKM